MKIDSQSLLTLKADKTYYIANSTGEIKEASFWQKFKCWTGFGDGRAKVRLLAEQVKAALLADGGVQNEATLDQEMSQLNLNQSLSGADLKRIATRFRADHSVNVAKADAGRFATAQAETYVDNLLNPPSGTPLIHNDPQNVKYIKQIAIMAAKTVVPDVQPDTSPETLKTNVRKRLSQFRTIWEGFSYESTRLGHPCNTKMTLANGQTKKFGTGLPVLDSLHYKLYVSCMFNKEGKMIDAGNAIGKLLKMPEPMLTGGVKTALENADIPADLAEICNSALLGAFDSIATHATELPKAYEYAFDAARDDMRERYGNAIPKDAPIQAFAEKGHIVEALTGPINLARANGNAIKPEDVIKAVHDLYCKGAAKMLIKDFAKQLAEGKGVATGDVAFLAAKRNPNLVSEVVAAKSPEEAKEVLARHKAELEAIIAAKAEATAATEQIMDNAAIRIAEATGMDAEDVKSKLNIDNLERKLDSKVDDILSGEDPNAAEKDFSISTELNKIGDSFVQTRIRLLKDIDDAKDLSASAKATWKEVVLLSDKPDSYNISALVKMATTGSASPAIFKNALSKNLQEMIQMLKDITNSMMEEFSNIYGKDEWDYMGMEAHGDNLQMIVKAFMTGDKDIVASVQARRDELQAEYDNDNSPLYANSDAVNIVALMLENVKS